MSSLPLRTRLAQGAHALGLELSAEQLDRLLELLLGDERQGWRLSDATWTRDPAAEGEGAQDALNR